MLKIRLDFRNKPDCINKIKFLNDIKINYAVDFITNTNFEKRSERILSLASQMDPSK